MGGGVRGCIPGWHIVRTIGKGSFGTVYEVEKEDEFGGGIRSALKVITIPESSADIEAYRDDGYDDESITKLFRSRVEDITSEFRLMSKLKGCRNIVSYEDHTIVQHENNLGYDIFIRMELLKPLPKYVDQRSGKNAVGDKTVQKLGMDICRALERCAQHGIIHRDIKPQNIFINDDGDYKLGDFGVAKTSDHTTRATKTGTFGYMAPEVYWGKPYNASVDLYSLGLVLYWMLNERRGPFLPLPPEVPTPTQSAEALARRMSGEPLPAPKHGSEELKRIVLKACAFDPKDRYESATEMKRELERLSAAPDAFVPYAETKQANVPFAANDVEKTFGAFGTKPTPEETSAEEDEKTFGVFSAKPSTPGETPIEKDDKTFGIFGAKPSTPEELPIEEDEKTFSVFGARQPKEPKPVPTVNEAAVSMKRPVPAKPAEKPAEPKTETKPVRQEPRRTESKQPEKQQKQKKKSKLPIILSIAAALVIVIIVLGGQTSQKKAVFTDAVFEQAFRNKYGFTGTIYATDILDITELSLENCELRDISDVAQFRNLKVLNLSDNQISDITPLTKLTTLEHLFLRDNRISDINPLQSLTNLTNLNLTNNQISGVSALGELTKLDYLSLGYNRIRDISPISGLRNLKYLNLSFNQITDIAAIKTALQNCLIVN